MYERVNGVASIGSVIGGVTNWFSSGLGQSLLQIGVGFGTSYLTNQLGGSLNPGQSSPPPANNPPAPATIIVHTPTASGNETLTYTALALGGVALLYVLLKRK